VQIHKHASALAEVTGASLGFC